MLMCQANGSFITFHLIRNSALIRNRAFLDILTMTWTSFKSILSRNIRPKNEVDPIFRHFCVNSDNGMFRKQMKGSE